MLNSLLSQTCSAVLNSLLAMASYASVAREEFGVAVLQCKAKEFGVAVLHGLLTSVRCL